MFAKIFLTIVFFWFIRTSIGVPYAWEKDNLNNRETDCVINIMDDSIADEDMSVNEVKQKKHGGASVESIPAREERKLGYVRTSHHRQPKSCACNHEKRLVDLGPEYFPRYIADMVCLPGGCGTNSECRPKRYKLWVMRRRQDDEDPGTEPIPKDLREFWTGEPKITTIDCECTV